MAKPAFTLLQGDPATWPLPDAGKTALGVNQFGQLVIKQSDGSIVVVGTAAVATLNKQANSSGAPITVTPGGPLHTEVLTITGAARTQPVLMAATSLGNGSRATLLLILPATANLIVEVYNDASLVWSFTNQTGTPIKAALELFKDSGAWSPLSESIPAYN